MKKIYTILVAVLITASVFAQAPQKMTYQAVVRDNNSTLITSTQVGIEINIHQTTASGTLVYTESQTPTTNANGLLSIEIGGQTGFDLIDWANGPYFIETNIDVTGGNTYTITGVSKLLTVPYALHAKTAENITETDPIYSGSQAANITLTDITNLSNLSGTNTGDQNISRTGLTVTLTNGGTYQDSINIYTAGTGIGITNNVIKTIKPKFYLGQDTLGGIVYHIYLGANGEQHGLIVSKTETTTKWQNTAVLVNADRTEDGNYNMNLMSDSPAKDWVTTNFDVNWYLPSIDELSLLWHNRFYVNKTLRADGITLLAYNSYYWSSTEYNAALSFYFSFYNGYTYYTNKTDTYSVRSVRAF